MNGRLGSFLKKARSASPAAVTPGSDGQFGPDVSGELGLFVKKQPKHWVTQPGQPDWVRFRRNDRPKRTSFCVPAMIQPGCGIGFVYEKMRGAEAGRHFFGPATG